MARIKLPNFFGETRPLAISFICTLGVVFNIAWFIALLQIPAHEKTALIAMGYMTGPIAILQTFLSIIAYIGVWRMKWWGFILFLVINIAFYAYGIIFAQASLISIILHAIIALFFFIYCTKMD